MPVKHTSDRYLSQQQFIDKYTPAKTENTAAWAAYLSARFEWMKIGTPEAWRKSVELHKAIPEHEKKSE